jgi:magnesium transporter
MSKRIKKRSAKAGMPPGALVYVGERSGGTVELECIEYDAENVVEHMVTVDDVVAARGKGTGKAWINIDGVHDAIVLEKIGAAYGLHALTMEDILNTDQRPKMEDFDDHLFIVFKMLRYDAKQAELIIEQVSLILGDTYVLSFQEGIEGDVFNVVRERLRNSKTKIRSLGVDYLCYVLIDAVVDNYFAILEILGEEIEDLEMRLLENPTQDTMQTIHRMKRELIYLRKSVWPLREVIGSLQRGESPLITAATEPFLRDVYDHTIQVIDTVETYRDMLSGMIDIYMSSMSNRMNEVMKVLTIIATVFIPLTFIAGVYGMNFKYMPELEWPYGYAFAWALMVSVAAGFVVYFWKRKWL